MTKEEQRNEAILRIQELTKKFNLNSNMLEFFKNGKIYGLDYVGDENSKIKDRKKLISSIIVKRQNEDNLLIYYYFIVGINIGGYDLETLNIFYVSQYKEEWKMERLSEENELSILTYELGSPNYPEFGFIKVDSIDGNLIRTN